jgi:hypothetical protein
LDLSVLSLQPVARLGEEHPEDEEQTRDDDGVQDRVAQIDGDKRAHDGAQRYEDGNPGALPPVDQSLTVEMDGAHEPERDDAEAVGAVGHVLGQAEEVERWQRDGGAVAREGADEAADEAGYGDEDPLQRHPNPLPSGQQGPFYPRSRTAGLPDGGKNMPGVASRTRTPGPLTLKC